jgi:hypothetical protein
MAKVARADPILECGLLAGENIAVSDCLRTQLRDREEVPAFGLGSELRRDAAAPTCPCRVQLVSVPGRAAREAQSRRRDSPGGPLDLLLGRKTYEIFAAHRPYAEGSDDDSIAKLFNNTTEYVATRSTIELGSVALHDAAADVPRLKREDGPALVTQGSSDLIQTLLANDLIDQIN